MANTLGIGKKYLKHFVRNINSRWVLLCGGRRSGKSWAVHKWLWFLSSGQPKTVGVVAASFPALQLAINDFQRATGLSVTGNAIYGYSCQLSNGSIFQFRAFDDSTKVQGSTFDILYLEETLNIPEQVVSVLSMSVTGQIYCAFNPTKASFLDRYILPDRSNYIVTTFKDNPYLTESQREEFEEIKRKALLPTATVIDKYNYQVYYLGNFATYSGKVFKEVYNISDEEYDNVPAVEMYGLDFAFVPSEQSDATALIGVKIYDNCIYAKEYIYSKYMTSDKQLAFRMAELGIDYSTPIACDTGGLGKTRVHNLITAGDGAWTEPEICKGFYAQAAVKGKSVIEGITTMLQYDRIYVTDSSTSLRWEMDNLELGNDGKQKAGSINHGCDALRYGVLNYWLNVER